MTRIDNAAIAQQLGLSKEEMIARFGEPGTKTPEEIGNALGMDHDAIVAAFGEKNSTDSGDSFELTAEGLSAYFNDDDDVVEDTEDADDDVDDAQKTKDDKYEEVANALGYDALSVSAVMKYIENGNINGNPEDVVSQIASALGLPQTFVSNILAYLNNGQI